MWSRAAIGPLLLLAVALLFANAHAQEPAPDGGATPVLINEILAHTDPPLVDAVELYNPAASPVVVGGWCISDNPDEPCAACLPEGLVAPAGGYLVVTEEQLGFRLSEMGEELLLSEGVACSVTGGGQLVRFDASPNAVSMGRLVTSDGRIHLPLQRQVTLGAANSGPARPLLVMAEVSASPVGDAPEYVEILNAGTTAVALYDPQNPGNRWQLDGVGDVTLPQLALAPGQSLYLADSTPTAFRARYGLPAATLVVRFGGSLREIGERVTLLRPEPPNTGGEVPYVVIDEVGSEDYWPWSGGGAQARVDLTAFGQEPRAWSAATLLLESPATVQGLRLSVGPAGGAGGRTVRWQSAREWRAAQFLVAVEELTPAQGDGAAPAPLLLSLPAAGSRHQSASYAVVHSSALPGATYRYTLSVRCWDGSEQILRAVEDGPESSTFLPVVR